MGNCFLCPSFVLISSYSYDLVEQWREQEANLVSLLDLGDESTARAELEAEAAAREAGYRLEEQTKV